MACFGFCSEVNAMSNGDGVEFLIFSTLLYRLECFDMQC